MTNIAICGANGKMGRTIYSCIKEREDCTVIGGIDRNTVTDLDYPVVDAPSKLPVKPDVIIDFSNPACIDSLLEYCMSTGTPIVIGSTGYSDEQIAKIKNAAEQIPVFFTFNMSLGINLLVELGKRELNFFFRVLTRRFFTPACKYIICMMVVMFVSTSTFSIMVMMIVVMMVMMSTFRTNFYFF